MIHRVSAGTAIILIKSGRVLLGLRHSSHGNNTWSPPGGHIELGEDPVRAIIRETKEETGIKVERPQFIGFTNDIFEQTGKHYVTLWFQAETSQEAKTTAPNELDSWNWFSWNELPDPLFLPVENLIKSGLLDK